MSDTCQNLKLCEELFVKLSYYWKSALIGFLTLLSLGAGAWAWTWSEWKGSQSEQNVQISELQASFNELAVLKSKSNEILENQKIILQYVKNQPRGK